MESAGERKNNALVWWLGNPPGEGRDVSPSPSEYVIISTKQNSVNMRSDKSCLPKNFLAGMKKAKETIMHLPEICQV